MTEGSIELLKSLAPIAQIVGQTITWLLVIFGWFVVSRSNDRRETRKELRALVDAIRKATIEIETAAHEYFRVEAASSGHQGMILRRDILRLSGLLTTLKAADPRFDIGQSLMEFRQTITGGDFDSAERKARVPADRLFLEISSAAQTLLENLESAFAQAYPRL